MPIQNLTLIRCRHPPPWGNRLSLTLSITQCFIQQHQSQTTLPWMQMQLTYRHAHSAEYAYLSFMSPDEGDGDGRHFDLKMSIINKTINPRRIKNQWNMGNITLGIVRNVRNMNCIMTNVSPDPPLLNHSPSPTNNIDTRHDQPTFDEKNDSYPLIRDLSFQHNNQPRHLRDNFGLETSLASRHCRPRLQCNNK